MGTSIKDVKNHLSTLDLKSQIEYLKSLNDERSGIIKLLASTEKKYVKYLKEVERITLMSHYEHELKEKGFQTIVGVDEVGRGPLAGPVVTCAVVLKEWYYDDINDSKKVSLKHRERLFDEITDTALEVSYGMATPEEIDEHNILNATKLAMKRAIEGLSCRPDHLLIDAVKLDIDIPQTNLIKGDEKSVSIAAASILAKVTRDNMMKAYAEEYPDYDFASNKGYGTNQHYEGLRKVGISPIHRKSFVKDFI